MSDITYFLELRAKDLNERGNEDAVLLFEALDEIQELRKKLKATAQPVSVQAEPVWKPITKPGQVKVGDKLRFDLCGEPKTHTVKQVLDAGTDREEIIYHKGNNWYVITSMAIAGTGSQKNIEFLSSAAMGMGVQEGSKA